MDKKIFRYKNKKLINFSKIINKIIIFYFPKLSKFIQKFTIIYYIKFLFYS